ncbi:MAG: hypothetical protein LBG80_09840 [Bacteroidales bacterium]|jgi:hypothetical protein|nr:hypothetical protein [Bacteroidales bacterium]
MGKYIIDWLKFVREYLPSVLRTNFVDLAYVLLQGIRDTWFRFSEHINETDKVLRYNSQYSNMQRLLNDLYDSNNRHIKVYDGAAENNFLLAYPNEELKTIEIGFEVVYQMSEYMSYEGFIVELPNAFKTNGVVDKDLEDKIKRTVDNYKFASTKYTIIYK